MPRGAARETEAVDQQVNPSTPVAAQSGLEFPRFFSREGYDPFDEIEWESRVALIGSEQGEVVFEQRDVEIPSFWSQQATNIVVSKYFRGQLGSPARERSVKQLIGRVVDTITEWARTKRYFASEDDLQAFSDDLKHLLVFQKAAFKQPGLVQLRGSRRRRSAQPASSTRYRTRWNRS